MEDKKPEVFAIVNLMGHTQTAGRIELGALLRVDVPDESNQAGYRTSFCGTAAIYSIDIVSEEIARAYADRTPDIVAYDAPVVSKAMAQAAVDRVKAENTLLLKTVFDLQNQLRALETDPDAEIQPSDDTDDGAPF